jgi:hypothetical protein
LNGLEYCAGTMMERRISELELEVGDLIQRLRDAHDRAERAERNARDAWQFARSLMRRPTRPGEAIREGRLN